MPIEIDPVTGAPIVTPSSVEKKSDTTSEFTPKTDVPNDSNTRGVNEESNNQPAVTDVPPVTDNNQSNGDGAKSDAPADNDGSNAVEIPVEKSAQQILNDKIMAILAEYNNVEADIPYGHEYWQLRNQMLAFRR